MCDICRSFVPVIFDKLEARVGIEPTLKVLQTLALPLGYRAKFCLTDIIPFSLNQMISDRHNRFSS